MILALRTDGPTAQAWLYPSDSTEQPQAEVAWDSGRRMADELLSNLDAFLHESNTAWSDLTGLIIYSGPGSFTSLRIGHSVANALADSLGIPISGATGDDWTAHWEKTFQLIEQTVFQKEDIATAVAIQRGLSSGAKTHFHLGRLEHDVLRFHRNVYEALGGRLGHA